MIKVCNCDWHKASIPILRRFVQLRRVVSDKRKFQFKFHQSAYAEVHYHDFIPNQFHCYAFALGSQKKNNERTKT